MASNIRRPFNKYGAPVGMGQQRKGSAFLDNPDAPEEELEPYEKLPYNANEVNEQRDQPQAHTYSAPVSAPRMNPALDSAIQGSPRATNSNGGAQRTGGVQGPQSGISSLYGGSAQGPTNGLDKAKGMSFNASASNPYGDYGSESKLQYGAWQQMGPEEKQGALNDPSFKPGAAQSIYDESASAAQASGLGQRPQAGLGMGADGAWQGYGTANIPGAENVQWGDTSRLRGANTAEWGAGGTEGYEDNSHKNTFLKIASRYDPGQPGAARAMMADPEFQLYFPAATLVEHPKGDQIDFGDGRPVDVLINAREGGAGEAWAFQTMDGATGAGSMDMMSDPAFAGLFAQGPDASDAYALSPEDQSYSEQLRKIIASGQLEGLDQAILGNQQQPQDDPNDPLAALRKSPRQRSL